MVMKWSRGFPDQGKAALVSKRPGRKRGSGRTLTLLQELKLREMILEGAPSQLKLPFALWNRRFDQEAVCRLFGLVSGYLLRSGFTPQRPTRQAIKRNEAVLCAWMDLHF
ncbi:winged helix-turn-helix domain-containing protein [Pseudothauera rhizosphaerae]|uniref:Winged helix-turn-helix domain-containing protein n=1 Tax=Pseudothauera rhizosphaerae TaxID=2565932 RepID=A0A4S4APM5_9RHOO|nr:winged helix-turn-helix domain-containing protein [Pseudothauera rhizosphaerae]THF60380.1 winged helix-turn-helix domain-containing protein [Pseudothauera rhizosphaerae]